MWNSTVTIFKGKKFFYFFNQSFKILFIAGIGSLSLFLCIEISCVILTFDVIWYDTPLALSTFLKITHRLNSKDIEKHNNLKIKFGEMKGNLFFFESTISAMMTLYLFLLYIFFSHRIMKHIKKIPYQHLNISSKYSLFSIFLYRI